MAATATTAKKHTDFVTYKLARWACDLRYEHLSPQAIQSAKLFLFDSFGCALGGSQQHDVQLMLKHLKTMGGSPTCTTFAFGFKTNPVDAAFLNALMVRAMD